MINVSSWSIRNPTPSVLLFIMLTLVGLMAFQSMKVQNFPDIDLPTVTVTAALPGADPAQLETAAARKCENSNSTLTVRKDTSNNITDRSAFPMAGFRVRTRI